MSAGHAHTAFISDAGELFLVGSNHFGQLGIGDAEVKKTKEPIRLCIRQEGAGSIRALSVSCGLFHTLALFECDSPDLAPPTRTVCTWGRPPTVLRSMMRGAQGRKYLTPSPVKVCKQLRCSLAVYVN